MTMLDDDAAMRDVINAQAKARAHKRENWTSFGWVVLIGLVIAGGAGLISAMHTASTSPAGPTVNSVRLEKQVRSWVVQQLGPDNRMKVKCPTGVQVKAGTVFDCLVSETVNGARTGQQVAVTIENDKGDLTWALSGGPIGLG